MCEDRVGMVRIKGNSLRPEKFRISAPSKAHNVYLSRQTLDIMIALKTCAGNSRYLLPSRYDADAPMSRAFQSCDLCGCRTGQEGSVTA
jgi:hypothetical protein